MKLSYIYYYSRSQDFILMGKTYLRRSMHFFYSLGGRRFVLTNSIKYSTNNVYFNLYSFSYDECNTNTKKINFEQIKYGLVNLQTS